MGIFSDNAPRYASYGLHVIPVGGRNGKRPLVRKWTDPVTPVKFDDWCRIHGDANLAVHAGHSELLIVDVDSPVLINQAIERFGDTPLQTRTPSGGGHLWYRANGELRQIKLDGKPIDILAGNSLLVAPPSVRPDGNAYRFVYGNIDDIATLPTILPGAFPHKPKQAKSAKATKVKGAPQPRGQGRNDALFMAAKDFAIQNHVSSLTEIMDFCREYNSAFKPPLPEHEVVKVAGSVWKMKTEGRLYGKNNRALVIPETIHVRLMQETGNVCKLFSYIWFNIPRDHVGFAICPEAMAEPLNMSPKTIRKFRNRLLEMGFIRRIHIGGSQYGDASLYVWDMSTIQ